MQLSRIMRRTRRLPVLWWIVVCLLAMAIGSTVSNSISRAEAAASRYQSTTRVAVATEAVLAGRTVEPGHVRFEERPTEFVPNSPAVDDPVGRVVTTDVIGGEVFVEANVGRVGLGPIASLLLADERAIAVRHDDGALRLDVDDRVDVIASFATPGGDETALTVAAGARVVGVAAETVSIAVVETEAPAVALASSQDRVALVLAVPEE